MHTGPVSSHGGSKLTQRSITSPKKHAKQKDGVTWSSEKKTEIRLRWQGSGKGTRKTVSTRTTVKKSFRESVLTRRRAAAGVEQSRKRGKGGPWEIVQGKERFNGLEKRPSEIYERGTGQVRKY